MLYVSSQRTNTACITDSETGESEWLSKKKIKDKIVKEDTRIFGAEMYKDKLMVNVYPYAETDAQVKCKFLNGYVYAVENGVLKSLSVDDTIKTSITIELGDICTSISAFSVNINSINDITVLLEFDDRIKYVNKNAFRYASPGTVNFGLYGVKNEKTLCEIYKAIAFTSQKERLLFGVFDDVSRFTCYNQEALFLYTDFDIMRLSEKVDDFLISRHKNEFLSSIPDKVKLDKGLFDMYNKNFHLDKLLGAADAYRTLLDGKSYQLLDGMITISDTVFSIMRLCGATEKARLVYKYMRFGGRDSDVHERFYGYLDKCVTYLNTNFNKMEDL